ncbi:hypothetical protein O6H91_Y239500 [Diphasiastrum complanatum]|nr:hypothetical protein O6H91_Y239500 [Diphasiastrum complanatum]
MYLRKTSMIHCKSRRKMKGEGGIGQKKRSIDGLKVPRSVHNTIKYVYGSFPLCARCSKRTQYQPPNLASSRRSLVCYTQAHVQFPYKIIHQMIKQKYQLTNDHQFPTNIAKNVMVFKLP